MNENQVIVDSSVWIAYFRKQKQVYSEINRLAETGKIRLLGLILAELYRGCGSLKEIEVVNDLKDVFPVLEVKREMWEEAGILSFKLKQKDINISLTNCYIAAVALESQSMIYSRDGQFKELARFPELTFYKPRT
ncbi:MAG: PIN domain-containing protein [bacterium]